MLEFYVSFVTGLFTDFVQVTMGLMDLRDRGLGSFRCSGWLVLTFHVFFRCRKYLQCHFSCLVFLQLSWHFKKSFLSPKSDGHNARYGQEQHAPQDPDQHPRGPLTLVGVVPAVVGAVTLEQRRDTAAVPTPKLLLALTWRFSKSSQRDFKPVSYVIEIAVERHHNLAGCRYIGTRGSLLSTYPGW